MRTHLRCNSGQPEKKIQKLYDMVGVASGTNWIEGQKLQWLGHIMRREMNNIVKLIIE